MALKIKLEPKITHLNFTFKQMIILLSSLILLISIPITVSMVQKQQEIRVGAKKPLSTTDDGVLRIAFLPSNYPDLTTYYQEAGDIENYLLQLKPFRDFEPLIDIVAHQNEINCLVDPGVIDCNTSEVEDFIERYRRRSGHVYDMVVVLHNPLSSSYPVQIKHETGGLRKTIKYYMNNDGGINYIEGLYLANEISVSLGASIADACIIPISPEGPESYLWQEGRWNPDCNDPLYNALVREFAPTLSPGCCWNDSQCAPTGGEPFTGWKCAPGIRSDCSTAHECVYITGGCCRDAGSYKDVGPCFEDYDISGYKVRCSSNTFNVCGDLTCEYRLPGSDTAVTLVSFTATAGNGQVILDWETASEINSAGFWVNQGTQESGTYTRISPNIPATGDSIVGDTYQYTDTSLVNGITYYYKLEEVDYDQGSTFYGPVSATPSSKSAPTPTPDPASCAQVGKRCSTTSKNSKFICCPGLSCSGKRCVSAQTTPPPPSPPPPSCQTCDPFSPNCPPGTACHSSGVCFVDTCDPFSPNCPPGTACHPSGVCCTL